MWSEKPLYGVLQKGDGCAWGLQQKRNIHYPSFKFYYIKCAILRIYLYTLVVTAGTCCEQCGTFLGTMQLQLHLHGTLYSHAIPFSFSFCYFYFKAGNVTAKDISKALKQNDATTLTQYLLEPVLPCISQEDCTLTHDIVPSKSDYAEFPLFCSESCRL